MKAIIYNDLTDFDKDKLLTLLKAKTLNYHKSSTVLNNFTNTDIVGIINSGSVNIISIDYNGNKTIIETLKENDLFYSKMFVKDNNELSVISIDKSSITLFDYQNMIDINIKYQAIQKKFIENFLQVVITRLNNSYERINVLTKKTIREKLLEYFRNEANKKHKKTFMLNITLTDLADYLAIDRSAMMREIKHLKEDRIIVIENKKVTINV